MTALYSPERRSQAAKLGWQRRRDRVKRQAKYQAEVLVAEQLVANERAKGVDARLLGNRCIVVDSRVPQGMYMTFDMDRFRQMSQE